MTQNIKATGTFRIKITRKDGSVDEREIQNSIVETGMKQLMDVFTKASKGSDVLTHLCFSTNSTSTIFGQILDRSFVENEQVRYAMGDPVIDSIDTPSTKGRRARWTVTIPEDERLRNINSIYTIIGGGSSTGSVSGELFSRTAHDDNDQNRAVFPLEKSGEETMTVQYDFNIANT